ncbi:MULTISPECIES: hypothetical protein [Arthrobacter]|uniref:Uncharacterized protein n=1 Tax=Arthrobacter jinronghuae TaxID=2964609 RepID=A0ABT1NUF1_9MICC|nr:MULTISPECIES: hypothetical protein [Arthrobacter]MCC9175514.1 hypothetical protein [Arthrobacter sp. zg-Y179]MCQ1950727.1 hypothetical protein [Arthrobacter jinronghuae]MCQ1954049.1 hypothetical protein [Arthrobacter sp. zg-Y238]MCQ1956947.1 hypothetical protein [Arthrobacter jinronghuae]UWX79199.1 hypothetical protein N2K98_03020 [Arthrobacter jinronghuae]
MTTEPTGPANDAEDPLGPSAPQPGPTGEPRRPGSASHSAGNIRDDQGTSPAGAVPAAQDKADEAADAEAPSDSE